MILQKQTYKRMSRSIENNYETVTQLCKKYITPSKKIKILDVGCGDGALLKDIFDALGLDPKQGYGIEIHNQRADEARQKGFNVKSYDLNGKSEDGDSEFDYIIANQIIEHLHFTDNFMEEMTRILKPGGILIISSTNLAALHNRLFLLFGYQPNCLHPARKIVGTMVAKEGANPVHGHKSVFTGKALKEFVRGFGYKILFYETETIPIMPKFMSKAVCRIFDFGTHVTIVAKKREKY